MVKRDFLFVLFLFSVHTNLIPAEHTVTLAKLTPCNKDDVELIKISQHSTMYWKLVPISSSYENKTIICCMVHPSKPKKYLRVSSQKEALELALESAKNGQELEWYFQGN